MNQGVAAVQLPDFLSLGLSIVAHTPTKWVLYQWKDRYSEK